MEIEWEALPQYLPYMTAMGAQWEKELAERVKEKVWAQPVHCGFHSHTAWKGGENWQDWHKSYAERKAEKVAEMLHKEPEEDNPEREKEEARHQTFDGEAVGPGSRVAWEQDGVWLEGDVIDNEADGLIEVLPDGEHETEMLVVTDCWCLDGYGNGKPSDTIKFEKGDLVEFEGSKWRVDVIVNLTDSDSRTHCIINGDEKCRWVKPEQLKLLDEDDEPEHPSAVFKRGEYVNYKGRMFEVARTDDDKRIQIIRDGCTIWANATELTSWEAPVPVQA